MNPALELKRRHYLVCPFLALVSNLNARGIIPNIKAELHGEIMSAMQRGDDDPPPRPPPIALLINDLIREYFSFTGKPRGLSVYMMMSLC